MPQRYLDRTILHEFLHRLSRSFARPGRIYLIGESTHLLEGWRERTDRVLFAPGVAPDHRAAFTEVVRNLRAEMGIEALDESPGDVIPLPAGYEMRARPASAGFGQLQVFHFDPYSVAFRFIARGDEPDYHAVIAYLQHGWLTVGEMDALLNDLLPQFTNETIQQDPAEFRRKYRGLLQMWRAAQAQVAS